MPMIVDRTMKKGTLLPPLQLRLGFASEDEDITGFVTEGTPVTFTMKARGATIPIIEAGEARVAAIGAKWVDVEYEWVEGDTDVVGLFFGEFTFTIGDKPLPAPTSNYVAIRVINTL